MTESRPGAASSPDVLCDLGNSALKAKHLPEAITLYRRAITLDPRHRPSRKNLALALRSTERYGEAADILLGLLAEQPDDGFLYNQLGKVHVLGRDFEAALDAFHKAAALDPNDADSLYWIGGVRHSLGDLAAAEAGYARAAEVRPLIRRPANRAPPAFAVLLLCAPVAANTPAVYLTEDAPYETNILLLFHDARADIDRLRWSAQVLVNLVSDADQAGTLLPIAADLVDRIGLPVVNHPRKVRNTTREAIAQRLASVEGCRVPRTLRLPKGADPAAVAPALPLPLLVRPVGTHGGEAFEKFDDATGLAAFLGQHPSADHYLIEPIDYASADGYFRKYRFILVDGEIFQYHLAIGDHWKVHHATTDMINQAWMRDEERAFLDNPGTVFTARNYAALRAIQTIVGLDFFGIDCGLDRDGRLVVFEVNSSMLVHPHNENFPYKIPHVQAIRRAFDAMLGRRAADQTERGEAWDGNISTSI